MPNRLNFFTPGLARFAVLLLAASLMFGTAQASTPLTPHTAEYKVKMSIVSGKLRTELKATDSGYIATHVLKPSGFFGGLLGRGSVVEVSEFANSEDGISPVAYQSDDTLTKKKTRAKVTFDWDTNEVSGTVNDEEMSSILEGLHHDRVSVQYQLMHDLLNSELGEHYLLFDVDKLRTLNVRSIGTKKVKVPAGKYEAIGIQHQSEGSSRVTTFWCVAELGYLPVMIERHRKGKLQVRVSLRKYSPTQ